MNCITYITELNNVFCELEEETDRYVQTQVSETSASKEQERIEKKDRSRFSEQNGIL